MKKVVLKVKGESELFKFKEFAKDVGVTSALIRDAGKTQLDPGTITCLAIGPDEVKKVDSVSGELKMM